MLREEEIGCGGGDVGCGSLFGWLTKAVLMILVMVLVMPTSYLQDDGGVLPGRTLMLPIHVAEGCEGWILP